MTEVIRLFYHADVENFTMDKYNNDDENAHSFTIKKGPITFTAYDKNYEVKHNKKLGNEYDEKILRIEIKVERDGFKSSFNLDKEVQEYSFDELLHHAYKSRKEILNRYLTMLFPGTGQHLPYQKAVAKIKTEANEKYREAMVLLLEKTSRLKNYTRAKEETKKIFKLGERNIRYLIDEFNRINVNPITMKKDAKTKCVECLRMVDF